MLVTAGWLEVYGKEAQAEDEAPNLAPVKQGEQVATRKLEIKQSVTKPPPRYTEATLLSAMEGAGKLVEDDELREAMSEKGLGTPATRASIIEGLILETYMTRHGKELQATAKAFMLMELLDGLGVNELTKPELTGGWEFKLRQVQRRQKSREEFMAEIAEMTRQIVGRAKQYEHDTIPGDFGVLAVPCPKCGGEVHEKYRNFPCVRPGCDFSLPKILAGRLFENPEIEQFIRERQIGPLQGFRSKQGFPFAALLKLTPEHRIEFDFGDKNRQNAAGEKETATVDLTGKNPLGKCPKCGARVFDAGMNYLCEHGASADKKCNFRTGKVILQQAVDEAQLQKLLTTGKTDLLKGFVSNKTGRKFEAFLVLKEGEVKFEFAPREPRAAKTKEAKAKEPPAKLDFSKLEPLGKCPKCGSRVFEGPTNYVCERTQADTMKCTFKTGKLILQQPVDHAQLAKLLSTGRTELLDAFISSKTGRPFKAYLILDDAKKVTFEFPPRD